MYRPNVLIFVFSYCHMQVCADILTRLILSVLHIKLRVLGSRRAIHWACSPFVLLSLLDRQDKWKATRKDMNSKMHFCLSAHADCSSNHDLLCLETLMPLLDIESCIIGDGDCQMAPSYNVYVDKCSEMN